MKSKGLLIDLIGLLDEYETSQGDQMIDLRGFISFLNATKQSGQLEIRDLTGGLEADMIREETTADVEIARLISVMYHYAKTYIRKALKDSPLQTVDEFTFVIILLTHDSLSKMELITLNIMEKTSGIGIINRLISKGLIFQFSDEKDKRAQRVAVTEKGRAEIFSVLPNMNLVSNIITGNLSVAEKDTLAYLLKKLDYHHHDLYTNKRDAGLEELLNPG
jgi:DNA-binding MarR family transcriptional regulator